MLDYEIIDDFLEEIGRELRLLHYLQPINTEEQKRKFLDKFTEPKFEYRELGFDAEEKVKQLEKLKIPEGELTSTYEVIRRELLQQLRLLKKRGNRSIAVSVSSTLHGKPNKELVEEAKRILTQKFEALEKNVSSNKIETTVRNALKNYGLTDWQVIYHDSQQTSVDRANKEIKLNRERMFTELDITRLVVHEIGVHVLRAVNGEEQHSRLFVSGFPGYLQTEEGLAAYVEEITGNSSLELLRTYALRVIAANAVHEGKSFKQTFDELMNYGTSKGKAWQVCLRIFRGGGYVKDHIYLQGMLEVKLYVSEGGSLSELYVGKIGIQDLQLMKELKEKRILKLAKIIPEFISH